MAVVGLMYTKDLEVDVVLSSGNRLSLPKQSVFLVAFLDNLQWIGLCLIPWCGPICVSARIAHSLP